MLLTVPRPDFSTQAEYHRLLFGGKDIILRCSTALAQLGLFLGYLDQEFYEVYSKYDLGFENVSCLVVDSFDDIEHTVVYGVPCTTASRTFKDLVAGYRIPDGDTDIQGLVEGLARYWHLHGGSFEGLTSTPENAAKFGEIKGWAISFYDRSI